MILQNDAVNEIARHFGKDDLFYPAPVPLEIYRDENEQTRSYDTGNSACSANIDKFVNVSLCV